MACTYCVGAPDWEIKKYTYWTAYLKKNQAYLGTTIIALNRHIPDLFSATKEEIEELQTIIVRLTGMMKELFGAKMFAYMAQSSLENLHANIQIIPRYDQKVRFGDVTFSDPQFGRGYDPVRHQELRPSDYSEMIIAMQQKLEGTKETENREELEVPRPE